VRRRRKILLGVLATLLVLAGAAAWEIHTWGRPVPVAYRRVAVTPANPGGGRSFAYVRLDERGQAGDRVVALDADNDGTVDQVLTEGGAPASFARPAASDPDARWLILCLDGVPYQEMLALWEEGYFREFFRPAPLISPFPSDSESALTDVFHAGPVPGYEHRYFDRAANRLAGGALTTLTGKNIPYLELLDYDMPGYFKGVTYLLPHKSYRADLGRLRKRFLASREKVFLAHIASSDSLYHILPKEEMRVLLTEVDSLLRELYFDSGGKLRITLFSDHGNSLVESRPVPLKQFLESHGWRLNDRFDWPNDVVVPAYGLVGFMAVYCGPKAGENLARDLVQMEGVDFVVRPDTNMDPKLRPAVAEVLRNSVLIESSYGRARVVWKPDASAFGYELLGKTNPVGPPAGVVLDPLGLPPPPTVYDVDMQTGRIAARPLDPWRKDAEFFAATAGHRYPDVGYRLWQWATNHVENRADILVSLKPGYYYGSGAFQRFVTLYSTHGALDAAQSLGFAMSTDAPRAGPIRGKDLLPEKLKGRKSKSETRNSD